jgi:hypothetical protein
MIHMIHIYIFIMVFMYIIFNARFWAAIPSKLLN